MVKYQNAGDITSVIYLIVQMTNEGSFNDKEKEQISMLKRALEFLDIWD